ncbi:MAG TPA: ubiquitin-like domain-containing protein [Pseudogracilibacillus sp.]|nr:ubiquitin-like domain-containing protein [Pseudogracilibacillus sp.]
MQKLLKPLMTAKSKSIYSIFSVIMVTLFSTWAVFDGMKAEVVFAENGEEHTVKTTTDTVGEFLDDQGVEVGTHDELSHGENAAIEDGMKIEYETSNKVLLTIDGETEEYHTTAETVGEFFQNEGLEFSKHDEITQNNAEDIRDNIEIEVEKAFPVVVKNGKDDEEKLWTTGGGTVKELLKENDISYEKKDKIKPGLKKKVKEDMEISITKVKKEEEKEEESIPFETEEEEDSSLEKGKTETKQEGKEGTVVKTYEVTYENGKEVKRKEIDEKVVEEEQNEIIAVGTKEEPKPEPKKEKKSEEKSETKSEDKSEPKAEPTKSSAESSDDSSSSESSSGGKEMTMEATAYGPDCSGCSGVSATGMNLKDSSAKVIAVDPSVIPLGSRVWVEGYGEAVAGDTGGAIKGNRIDVLYPSESEAGSWGRKSVNVKVLD